MYDVLDYSRTAYSTANKNIVNTYPYLYSIYLAFLMNFLMIDIILSACLDTF